MTHAAVAVHRQLRNQRMANKHPGGARNAALLNRHYKHQVRSAVVETKATDVTRGVANNSYPPRGLAAPMAAQPPLRPHDRLSPSRGVNIPGLPANTLGVNANTLGLTSNVIDMSSNTLGVSGMPFMADVADIGAEIFALNDR